MSDNLYVRKLNHSEATRHFIHIMKRYRDMFPEPRKTFNLTIEDDTVQVIIDNRGNIGASLFHDLLPCFTEGGSISILKLTENHFSIQCTKDKSS